MLVRNRLNARVVQGVVGVRMHSAYRLQIYRTLFCNNHMLRTFKMFRTVQSPEHSPSAHCGSTS